MGRTTHGRQACFARLLVMIATSALGLFAASIQAGELRAGAAAVKIPPPLGVSMAGYYSPRGAEGVHDDLFAKALVLEKDGVKVALVVLDVIRTHRDHVLAAREKIEKTTGIQGDHVMISATHTHTGPEVSAASLRAKDLGAENPVTLEFNRTLPDKIAEAVQQANAALAPVKVSTAIGHEDSIAFNRRYFMKDGTVAWNPGKLNPNIVKPAGPIDPAVPVIYFETPKKKPVATYVNYAVHLDNVGGTHISADLPHTLSKCLADVKGREMVTLYATGACGDINHLDVNWAEPQKGHDNAARMGVILAAEVLRTFPKFKAVEPGPLRARSALIQFDLPKVTPEQVEQARKEKDSKEFLKKVNAYKVLDVAARQGKPLEVEVQVITLGRDIAWVSLPGEIFVELGLAIKEQSPFPVTAIAELANGSIGYIPTARAYPQGNYEVVSARCAEGSGEKMVETAVKLLKECHAAQ
ncbi:MAG: neutral/alkaline non-lysosomal ceramidase N-terminal domain-containing protein [Candidatus Sumerlaeia bacterium]|nr:neutral/alkaline non-lysosomal ceramidase N-terminal domain-containing protein [Candidatus Sumerlaeia bacterium]